MPALKNVDTDVWWNTRRVVASVKHVNERDMHYWNTLNLLNFTRFGVKNRYYHVDEVYRISIMAFLVNRAGFSAVMASKTATMLSTMPIVKGVVWGKYNGIVVGVPLEEIYSEAISN